MSEHEWVRENLDAYVAGALSAAELGRVAQHVADCADCKEALTCAQKMETTMAELFADARPDAKLEDRMIRRLRKVRVPFRWSTWMRFAAGAAAVVMLGIVGAVVQAVAAGGSFPGINRESAARTQSANDLKRIATTFYHREGAKNEYKDVLAKVEEARTGSLMLSDVSGSMDAIDSEGVRQDLKDIRDKLKENLADAEQKYLKFRHDPLYDGEHYEGKRKTQESGYDQGKAEKNLGGRQFGANGTTYERNRGFGFGNDGILGVEVSGKPGKESEKSVKGLDGNILEQRQVQGLTQREKTDQAYFKPSDSLAQTTPPAVGKPAGTSAVADTPALRRPDEKAEPSPVFTQPKQDQPGADPNLKIIRTGEMEFEIDSFDNAVKAVMALIKPLQAKGAFKLKEDSSKQANGKTRGHVVVRMPPQFLDDFVLDLRRELAKVGELKLQQIGSQDVTKVFTDTESELKAARAVEKRLLAIIENGKGDVKDLVAAEKELGLWRTKIEKMEGEIRYYSNQVALSTLTITLTEKEITAAAALVVNGTVKMRIEVDHVSKAREAIEKAVEEFKGRIVKSDEKQYPAGQVEAIVHAEIPPASKDTFRKTLEKLGIVSGHEDTQSQTTESGAAPIAVPRRRVNDILFQVTLNNIVNIKPKQSVKLDVVTTDVRSNFEKLKDEITRVFKGQVRDAKLDENQDKQKAIATIDFSVPTEKKAEMDKLLAGIGPALDRVNTQAAITEIATEQKFGYQLTLYSIATVEPREKVRLHVEVNDVEGKSAAIAELVKAANGQLAKPKSGLNKAGMSEALLVINVPLTQSDRLVRDIKDKGKVIDWAQAPNTSVPENDLATAQIAVVLTGPDPSIPRDEGLGKYASKSLYVSYTVFVNCVLLIFAGIAFILPWAVVIYITVWLVRRIWGKPVAKAAAPTTPEPLKP
jgi:Domain of unknown function (DUF4349)/Putative zinc-finger